MPARTWYNRWYSRSAACLLAALLLNALTLAPARHRHDECSGPNHCAVCLLQSGTAWAPIDPPILAPPTLLSEAAPTPPIEAPRAPWACRVPGRGPPATI